MSNVIIRIGNNVILFVTLILLTNLNLSAQYKLELEWQKDMERIISITKSDNDSLLYVAFENLIITANTSDGSIVKRDSVDGSYDLCMSKDGKTIGASNSSGAGFLDPITFQRIYWDKSPSIKFIAISLNEKLNKFVASGTSGFIKIYDVNTKSLFKEFKAKYSVSGDILLENSRLSGDGKYIIYSYVTNVQKFNYYLTIMDLEGNIVKEFLETSSTNFTLTNDCKTLIYFKSDAIHFFDLETMKEKGIITSGGLNPTMIDMSSDGKNMLLGFTELSKITNSLVNCDLDNKLLFYLREFGAWDIFKLKNDNSNLFSAFSNSLYKWKFVPNTTVFEEQNKQEISINILDNKLILSNPQNHQINTLTAYDILGRTFLLSANGNEVDISSLSAGKYFLKVVLADGSFLDFGFVVE